MFCCHCSRLKVSVSFTKAGGSGGRSTYTVTSLFILMLEFQFRGNLFTSFINTRTKRRLGFIEKGRKLGKRERGGREERNAQVRLDNRLYVCIEDEFTAYKMLKKDFTVWHLDHLDLDQLFYSEAGKSEEGRSLLTSSPSERSPPSPAPLRPPASRLLAAVAVSPAVAAAFVPAGRSSGGTACARRTSAESRPRSSSARSRKRKSAED